MCYLAPCWVEQRLSIFGRISFFPTLKYVCYTKWFPTRLFLSAISSTLHSSCQLQLNCQKAVACFPFWLMSATTCTYTSRKEIFFFSVKMKITVSFTLGKNSVLLKFTKHEGLLKVSNAGIECFLKLTKGGCQKKEKKCWKYLF